MDLSKVDLSSIVGRLMNFGVPHEYAEAVERLIASAGYARSEVAYLQKRIEYLLEHVPEDIRNPPPPAPAASCRSKWE
jgi:hypothetical protein